VADQNIVIDTGEPDCMHNYRRNDYGHPEWGLTDLICTRCGRKVLFYSLSDKKVLDNLDKVKEKLNKLKDKEYAG
jgi:hypothetical protein